MDDPRDFFGDYTLDIAPVEQLVDGLLDPEYEEIGVEIAQNKPKTPQKRDRAHEKLMADLKKVPTATELHEIKEKLKEKPEFSKAAMKWRRILGDVKQEHLDIMADGGTPDWTPIYAGESDTSGITRMNNLLKVANTKSGYWPRGIWWIRSRREFHPTEDYFVRAICEVKFEQDIPEEFAQVVVKRQARGQRSYI